MMYRVVGNAAIMFMLAVTAVTIGFTSTLAQGNKDMPKPAVVGMYQSIYSIPTGGVLGVQLPIVSGESPSQAYQTNERVIQARWPGAILLWTNIGGGTS